MASEERRKAQEAVEAARDELASTVEEFAAKFDVKARARDGVEELKERHREGVADLKERARAGRQEARTSGFREGVRKALGSKD
jgi:hypothetical protein